MRKTTRGLEKSVLDVFIACDKIVPYITRMKIDEKWEQVLSNYSKFKQMKRVIESDHNPIFLYLNLQFSKLKNESNSRLYHKRSLTRTL